MDDEDKDVTETRRSHPAQALLGLLSVQAVSAEWTQLELDPACPTVVTEGSGGGGWRLGSSPESGVGSLADTAQDGSCHADEESETQSSCPEVQ